MTREFPWLLPAIAAIWLVGFTLLKFLAVRHAGQEGIPAVKASFIFWIKGASPESRFLRRFALAWLGIGGVAVVGLALYFSLWR